ncbi:tachykinin-like peptides receptor 99D, partial [Leptotrombidium deliense]
MSRKMALNITFTIWLFSCLLSSPNFIYSVTVPQNNTVYLCYILWPDGAPFNSLYEYVYNLVLFVVTYTIPITSMFLTYYRVGVELWGSQSIGECTAKQMSSIKSKRKIVKMMIFVFLIFAICWLPYHVYFILLYHFPQISQLPYIQHIYLSIYWLAMSNSMYNPFIYCWMNSR